jgi:hypothetical protein
LKKILIALLVLTFAATGLAFAQYDQRKALAQENGGTVAQIQQTVSSPAATNQSNSSDSNSTAVNSGSGTVSSSGNQQSGTKSSSSDEVWDGQCH